MAVNIIVESGVGLLDSNSYAAVADGDTYFTNVGNAAWTGTNDAKASALIRTTAWIDATYRGRYPGYRVKARLQGLEWPRVGAYTYDPDNGRSEAYAGSPGYMTNALFGYAYIPTNQVPREVIHATLEGAVRELVKPGVLSPDLARGGDIKLVRAGSVEIEYGPNASPITAFQVIDLALRSLLMASSPYSSRATRG